MRVRCSGSYRFVCMGRSCVGVIFGGSYGGFPGAFHTSYTLDRGGRVGGLCRVCLHCLVSVTEAQPDRNPRVTGWDTSIQEVWSRVESVGNFIFWLQRTNCASRAQRLEIAKTIWCFSGPGTVNETILRNSLQHLLPDPLVLGIYFPGAHSHFLPSLLFAVGKGSGNGYTIFRDAYCYHQQ